MYKTKNNVKGKIEGHNARLVVKDYNKKVYCETWVKD